MAEYRVYADPGETAHALADYLSQYIVQRVRQRGECHVILPGGGTPALSYRIMAERDLPWENIHWYPSDERCLPVGHKDRNDTMILENLLPSRRHHRENLHAIPAELGPQTGAERISNQLGKVGLLDVALLGMGEDAHTASLFPGNPALQDQRLAVPVYDAPKPPPERVSLGLGTLRNAGQVIVLATGKSKKNAMLQVKHQDSVPAQLIEPDLWFVDKAALPDQTGRV